MWQEIYVREKLRELEAVPRQPGPIPASKPRQPLLAPLARSAGRALCRIGEGLQLWAAPARPEGDAALT